MSFVLPSGRSIEYVNLGEALVLYREIFEQKVYLAGGLMMPDHAVVVDVGANIGLFTLFALETCPSAFVHAFEPAPLIFELLRQNVRGYCGVALNNCGVREASGDAVFTFLPRCTAFSGYDHDAVVERLSSVVRKYWTGSSKRRSAAGLVNAFSKTEQIATPVRSLSSYIAEREIDRIDLLKIDVEGDEHAVLAGIDLPHWDVIRQVAIEVHEVDALAEVTALLAARQFVVDAVSTSESIHMVYGRRR